MMTTATTTSMMMKIKETYLENLQPAQVRACVGRGLFSAKLTMMKIFIDDVDDDPDKTISSYCCVV